MKKRGPRITRITRIFFIFFIICVNLCNLWTFSSIRVHSCNSWAIFMVVNSGQLNSITRRKPMVADFVLSSGLRSCSDSLT